MSNIEQKITKLLRTQPLAVIATPSKGHPYTNLIAFTHSDDLRHIYFATLRQSQKYRNICSDPRISVLVDDRQNDPSDFSEASSVTALGSVGDLKNENEIKENFLQEHPYLKEFLEDEDCILLSVEVERYLLVQKFQDVIVFEPGSE